MHRGTYTQQPDLEVGLWISCVKANLPSKTLTKTSNWMPMRIGGAVSSG